MKFLSQFKKLKFPLDQYAIFGSGPIAVREIRKIKDLDVVVKDELYREIITLYHNENMANKFCENRIYD